MEIRNGKIYQSNYERGAAFYMAAFGEKPKDKTQMAAYAMLQKMYECIAGNPEQIGLKPKEDVFFAPWEKQKGREKDVKTIRDAINRMEALMRELYELVKNGELVSDGIKMSEETSALKQTISKLLQAVDVNVNKAGGILEMDMICAKGLKLLAQQEFPLFCRGIFHLDGDWLERNFDAVLGAEGTLVRLCEELGKRGYKQLHRIEGKRIFLDYVKEYGKKPHPVKMSWADKYHAGIEVSYEDIVGESCYVWLRVPDFENVLKQSDQLSQDVKKFLVNHIKQCDGCRYCVQTDKTGKRPLAAVALEKTMKCPRFPSFSMNWRSLSDELAEDMLKVLDEVEEILLQ